MSRMQIGTRWRTTDAPPASVPSALRDAVLAAEVTPDGWWTLTWLEGRAVAEHDDGLRLRELPDGSIARQHADEALDDSDEDDELFP